MLSFITIAVTVLGLPITTFLLLIAVIGIPVVAFLLFINDQRANEGYISKWGVS